MASTFKCNKCGQMYRTASPFELELHKKEHKKQCSGIFESIWKNYDKMSNKEKEMMFKAVIFRQGIITERKGGE